MFHVNRTVRYSAILLAARLAAGRPELMEASCSNEEAPPIRRLIVTALATLGRREFVV